MDVSGLSAEELARELRRAQRMPDNYLEITCGYAAATLCASRAKTWIDGVLREYIGVSTIEVHPDHRGRGEMRRLLSKVKAAALLEKKCLCVTEVRSENLRRMMLEHPEQWKVAAWVCGTVGGCPESFVDVDTV